MSNMINHLPAWARTGVQNFVEKGTSPIDGAVKEPLTQEDSQMFNDMIDAASLELISTDNGPRDSDPRPGAVKTEMEDLGIPIEAHYASEGSNLELATDIAAGGAALYVRRNEAGADMVVMSQEDGGGSDAMAVHLDSQDPSKSFLLARM